MGRFVDLTGKRFSRLIVIERDKTKESSKGVYWVCQCDCGKIKSVSAAALKSGVTKSCGCLNKEIISGAKDFTSLVGKKFGKLTVIERVGTHISLGGHKKSVWLCKCDCGNEVTVTKQDLTTGHTKSCGCMSTKQKGSGLYDLTGKRFGKLIVIKRAEEDYVYTSKGKTTTAPCWICQCDCGNVIVVQGGNLRSGNTTNCGCERIKSKGEIAVEDFLTKNNIKHLSEYTFDDLRNKSGNLLRFDFAVLDDDNNVKMVIEYQGKQHYKDCGQFGIYQRKYSDKMKKDYCFNHNICLYEIRYDAELNTVFEDLLHKIVSLIQK